MRFSQLPQSRILMVDDQESNLLVLDDILDGAGYANRRSLVDSRQVCDTVREYDPDLILLDLMMPHLDGVGVLEQLGPLLPKGTYLPTIVLTADVTREARRRALSAGAHDFLTKPFDEEEVLLRVRNLLTTRALYLEQQHRADDRIHEQAAMLDKASDAILVRDMEQRITFWNKGAERLYGWSNSEAIGRNAFELLIEPPLHAALGKAQEETLAKGEWSGELQVRTRDGRQLATFSRWTLLRDDGGQPRGTLDITTDVTEKKKLEQQYLRSQRMEGLGTLAGGIAHDLNNVLTPIMMALELFRAQLSDPASTRMLDMLATSVQRGADMVKQVLSFSRGVAGQRVPLQLKHVIKETRALLDHSLPKGIEVKTRIASDLWLVVGDATHMCQVLMNLSVNARDAMPSGGRLTIEACNQVIDENYARMHARAKPGRHVVITVSDTGTGIPREIIDKIFEPFFTTKEYGKGTGLGLATVVGIVKSHGGFMDVNSEVGRGTQFSVYLPAAVEEGAVAARPKPPGDLPAGAGELILVVDDEEAIRAIARATLEAHGYRVVLANEGADALVKYAEYRDEVRAVLTDMMMPVMDGPTTIRALRKMDAHMPIIAASGQIEKGRSVEISTQGIQHFLTKPYTAEALLQALHAVLRGDPAAVLPSATQRGK